MTRIEFVEDCKHLDEAQLQLIAQELRRAAGSRIPPEVQQAFRSLDDATTVEEQYVETAWGKTHLFIVRKAQPGQAKRPILLNVHGGGWCLDHTERDTYFCRRMAALTGCLVLDVDYVLAPEHPYPAAFRELEAVLDILPALAMQHGGDIDRVIFCGQSAGGNLIGAVNQLHKVRPDYQPLAQILCYFPADNYNDHFDGQELDPRGKNTEYYGFFYNRRFEDRKNHDVSLALSSSEELRGILHTDIITAGLDNLKAEGQRYCELLCEAGVTVSYRCFEESRHGFLVNLYDQWQVGEDYVVKLIQQHLAEK